MIWEPTRGGVVRGVAAKLCITAQIGMKGKITTPEVGEGGDCVDDEDPARFGVPVAVANHTVIQGGEQSAIIERGEVSFLKEKM